jgi:hypothetical protein
MRGNGLKSCKKPSKLQSLSTSCIMSQLPCLQAFRVGEKTYDCTCLPEDKPCDLIRLPQKGCPQTPAVEVGSVTERLRVKVALLLHLARCAF